MTIPYNSFWNNWYDMLPNDIKAYIMKYVTFDPPAPKFRKGAIVMLNRKGIERFIHEYRENSSGYRCFVPHSRLLVWYEPIFSKLHKEWIYRFKIGATGLTQNIAYESELIKV